MKDETLLPPNSFTDDELMGMAHGDNPVANAYRELLEFRRKAAGGNSAQPVTVPDELIHHDKDPEVTKSYKIGFNACLAVVKSATATVPAGYVLVPVDPTPEMIIGFWGEVTHGEPEVAAAKEAYAEMLAAAPAAPDGWIPVRERMPPYGKYLVLYEFGRHGGPLEHAVAHYMRFDKNPPNKEIVSDWVCGVKGVHNITHWQPLPDAPKVKP